MIKYFMLTVLMSFSLFVFADEKKKSKKLIIPQEIELFISNYWDIIKKDKIKLIRKKASFMNHIIKDITKAKKFKKFDIKYTYFKRWKGIDGNDKVFISLSLINKKKRVLDYTPGCYILSKEKNNYIFEDFYPECLID